MTQRSCQAKNKGRAFQAEAVLKEKLKDNGARGGWNGVGMRWCWIARQGRAVLGRDLSALREGV